MYSILDVFLILVGLTESVHHNSHFNIKYEHMHRNARYKDVTHENTLLFVISGVDT